MAANLKGRLARIRELGLVKAADIQVPGAGGEALSRGEPPRPGEAPVRRKPGFLEGWEGAGELAWKRVLRFENHLPESLDPAVFAPLGRRLSRDLEGMPRVAVERLRFFDLETTGLSGGTGTIAFLAAVGRVVEGEFELTQLFLEDYPGEGSLLASLMPLLEGDTCIVSYNGKAFDLPLLRTRCVMNAFPAQLPALHVDALFAARRLWKRVHGGASLGLLEREVLGIERGEDLPGSLIPEVWLSFARQGESPLMPLVLSHNADDVVGLARLVARIQAIFDEPRSRAGRLDIDRFGLGRSLVAAGRTAEGEELLEAAAADGDEGAWLLLARGCRRRRSVPDCLRVLELPSPGYSCAVERARIYERVLGDFAEAARWAGVALRQADGGARREALERRLARLERKLAGG